MLVDIFLQAELGAPADVYLRSGPSVVIAGSVVAGESPDTLASTGAVNLPLTGTPVYGVNTYYEFKGAFNPIPKAAVHVRPTPVKVEPPAKPPEPKKPADKPQPKPAIEREDDNDDEEVFAVIEAWLTVQQHETQ